MIRSVKILPTGDELKRGSILDTDSPMIMQALLRINPDCEICRCPVLRDDMADITAQILHCAAQGADLIVLIGGSGSGHLHSELLGKDFTHSAMEQLLDQFESTSLYGKNGHMWSHLICGITGHTMVINLPGPYVEAKAAIEAFCNATAETVSLQEINRAMSEAVAACYKCRSNAVMPENREE